MPYRKHFLIPLFFFLTVFSKNVFAQPTWTLDPFGKEQKPEEYEEKKLASEKTGDKKFTTFRRFLQNSTTHYNYYFNAINKLNAVIERAKSSNVEDYSRLLSFYPFTLENTATQQTDLDSVIYKATAGILLHDLRSDWVDNMYLLIGKSYYYRKEFDSAALTFQFINYNLFPRKKNEDDNRIVGANSTAKSSVLSIANKENRNFFDKALSLPPSRNDALIWLAKTFTEMKEYSDAAGMINILHHDPNLPKRLRNDLAEVTAYWFFQQENYDSAAVHLELALSTAVTKQDKARWEYLLAQLYDQGGEFGKASDYYAKASKHTVDPVMDIFARLNDAKMYKDNGNVRELEKSIARLRKMARKDRFENYRDIIYYSTGELSLQKPDTLNAKMYYLKSVKYNSNNPGFRNKAFLQLADIAYEQKHYRNASSYYDSLQMDDPAVLENAALINARKNSLTNIVTQINIIEREDSLQMVAALSPELREVFIKKLVRKYRKENGLKEEDNNAGSAPITFAGSSNTPSDLFASPSKGEWYFYNASMKSKGYSEFKSKWGKRENADNWRRKSAIAIVKSGNFDTGDPLDPKQANEPGKPSEPAAADMSYVGLMGNLPLSPEKLDSSNALIASSLITLAKLFQNELEDYEEAITTYENYLKRFPDKLLDGEVYLGLYFCYTKTGDIAKADYYKNLLTTNFTGTDAALKITNPGTLEKDGKNREATKLYAAIYDLYSSGKFEEASLAKQRADSVYGKNYWTPQLLYIEAISFIKDRKDSNAVIILNEIINLYPESPLKEKSITMIDVLKRRGEIENYLSALEISRNVDDKILLSDNNTVQVQKTKEKSLVTKQITSTNKPPVINNEGAIKTPEFMVSGTYKWMPDAVHVVLMILDKIDGVYVNEAKNAFTRYNREKFYNKNYNIRKDAINAEKSLLVFEKFNDADEAMLYFDKIKKDAATEVSWLQPGKYSFIIISEKNLDILKIEKTLDAYKTLLSNLYPGKF